MPGGFRVLTTPTFEREFRKIERGDSTLAAALQELLASLRQDPHNRSGQYKIKKPAGLQAGEGQWRIRWRGYRLRYDISERDVVLHSFRHRKEAC
jgi:mRNA-degrading endonuclease RelE of RelBE toxin-antitoxin system